MSVFFCVSVLNSGQDPSATLTPTKRRKLATGKTSHGLDFILYVWHLPGKCMWIVVLMWYPPPPSPIFYLSIPFNLLTWPPLPKKQLQMKGSGLMKGKIYEFVSIMVMQQKLEDVGDKPSPCLHSPPLNEACPNTWPPKTFTLVQLHPNITELYPAMLTYCREEWAAQAWLRLKLFMSSVKGFPWRQTGNQSWAQAQVNMEYRIS